MPRSSIIIVSLGMLTIACNNNSSSNEAANRKNGYAPVLKTKEDSLFHDVMKGHDVGMAKIGKLRKNIDETQRQLDSINQLPSNKVNASYKQALTNLHKELNDANNEMNTWMDEFKADSATGNTDLRIKYLQQEKEKVTIVKEHILTSLQKADSLLHKN
jgi:hypothetical protein